MASSSSSAASGGKQQTVKQLLESIIERVPSVEAVIVSDGDGVELAHASAPSVDIKDINESISLISTFSNVSDQANKFTFGKNNTITTFFKNRTVIHVNHAPLVISFIAGTNANCGLLVGLVPDLKQALLPLQQIAASSQAI
mmetsp:Transcript_20102/g.29886  ORF Transcript_20102/g.29886 Transcript_20102/m.29886 type:complete len:142 (+) Transcript_20102:457-882(+)|eukprot:CAMPEP_0201546160 /NCGR_PEP_ID=MMETSP0173_2-20130828/2538_1 /ASSEMBLY_ACC=CAM_ASM_000268 /TAXON_ID=218659 /ORGANISM="Vexillifera sp., Strain DIVA3 564/2" /LENGTH=141 /DNA_ID=CAMNT_0047954763 /DNA_START=413 /DNA_END=838 /DNA_ORIENTATION=-